MKLSQGLKINHSFLIEQDGKEISGSANLREEQDLIIVPLSHSTELGMLYTLKYLVN